MPFNLDTSKQGQEVFFSNKAAKTKYPNVQMITKYKIVPIKISFGLILDETLTFNDHITSKLTTVN